MLKTMTKFIETLNHCTTLHQLKQIHACITVSGFQSQPFIIGKLVETSAIRFNHLYHALEIFNHTPIQYINTFTWNILIRSLSSSSKPYNALHLFVEMLHSPVAAGCPDSFTYAFVLKACGRAHSRESLEVVHAVTVKNGSHGHVYVANTAIHAYALCGDAESSRKMFDLLLCPDTVAWNAIITGYVQNGCPSEALELFCRMWLASVMPTNVTVIGALSACGQARDLQFGMQVHGFVSKSAMMSLSDINLRTALIDMYSRCGSIEPSRRVFEEMNVKDTGVWNALIGGYVHNQQFRDALQLFQTMQESGFKPDEPTLVSTLCACSRLGTLDVGDTIHAYVDERYPHYDPTLGTALIEMFARCGSIEKSKQVFDRISVKDAMAWTSMIGAFAAHGHAFDALEMFSLMQSSGLSPDSVTFVGVLSACSHAGLMEEGIQYFNSMKDDYHIIPRIEHYGCMIDLYSRAGRLNEAYDFISSIAIRTNPIIWRTLLSACRLNLDVELAELAVRHLRELGSDHCSDYVLISNIYASKGRWDDARRVRKQMQEGHIRKKSALSLIGENEIAAAESQS